MENNNVNQKVSVVAVHMGSSGAVLYKLSNGTCVSKVRAIDLAKEGILDGYTVSYSKFGDPYLKGSDGELSSNIQMSPRF